MEYFLDLFSPETYEAFSKSDRRISGFRKNQYKAAKKLKSGDRFICYMTRLSRWIGVLEIKSGPFEDDTPIFYEEDDPFIIRFEVDPIAWLEKEKAIPIRDDEIWETLTFTKGHDKQSSKWTGKIRGSLGHIDEIDAKFLEAKIIGQISNGKKYKIDNDIYNKLVNHRIRRLDKVVSVSVPQEFDSNVDTSEITENFDVRESIKIQSKLADIGAKMGHRIWIPRNDRNKVQELMSEDKELLIEKLPLNYDETTIKTIEQIDVLWLKGRAIVRAFEVEHTTSIYSGILRMADLLALQPNMDINLHIVAPGDRRDKVFTEIKRPVFSLLDRAPLYENCTYLSYDSIIELSNQPHLAHLSDTVLDDFSELAD